MHSTQDKRHYLIHACLITIALLLFVLVSHTDSYAATSGTLSNGTKWNLDTSTGVISFDGEIPNYTSEMKVPWYSNRSSIKKVELGYQNSVGNYAFCGCSNLEEVSCYNIKSSVIGSYAFDNCPKLKSIALNNPSIGYRAFFGCTSLKTLYITANVIKADTYAFLQCPINTIIVEGDSETWSSIVADTTNFPGFNSDYIRNATKTYCTIMDQYGTSYSYLVGNNLILDGTGVSKFSYNSAVRALVKEVTIGPDITAFANEGVFSALSNLEQFNVINGGATTSFYTVYGALLTYSNPATLIAYPAAKDATSFTVPDCVDRISQMAFYGAKKLQSVTFQEGTKVIGRQAFEGCTALTSITLPNSLETLEDGAFEKDSALVTVIFGTNIKSVGPAFVDCPKLCEVIFTGNAPEFAYTTFTNDTLGIYYPKDNDTWDISTLKTTFNSLSHITFKDTIHEATHNDITFTPWNGNTTKLKDGNYYLSCDITINSAIEIQGTVNLCLNGNVIRYSNNSDRNSVLYLRDGATLSIYDCDHSTAHKFSIDSNGKWVLDEVNGTQVLCGGCITGGTGHSADTVYKGGGVFVYCTATLNMYGGNIVGNSAKGRFSGSGIFIDGYHYDTTHRWGTVNLFEGSKIIGNYADGAGGGICNFEGKLNINQAEISYNIGSDAGGIAVIGPNAETHISNSTISYNNGTNYGGGIYTEGPSKTYLDSCSIISNKANHGGGIYVYTSEAGADAAQIIKVYVKGSCCIKDNTDKAGQNANNVYLLMGQHLELYDDGLSDDAIIGITESDYTKNRIVTSENANVKNFFSDSDLYHIVKIQNDVILQSHTYGEGEILTGATCETAGKAKYICTVCQHEKEEVINALGHDYGDAIFTWAEDYSSATAQITCSHDENHKLTGDAAVTQTQKIDATYLSKGAATYTAKITLGDQEYTETKDIEIPMLTAVTNVNKTDNTVTVTLDDGLDSSAKVLIAKYKSEQFFGLIDFGKSGKTITFTLPENYSNYVIRLFITTDQYVPYSVPYVIPLL